MMSASHTQRAARPRLIGLIAMIISVALLGASCSNNSQTEETSATSTSEDPVAAA